MDLHIKKKKFAFTIVELVIVIAVIAVLSAILIPTFVGLVNKANLTADQALIRNLNTSLALDEVENGKHKTMYDTLTSMKENQGYDISIISTKSKSEIVWDSIHNRFVLVSIENEKTTYFTGTDNYEYSEGDYVHLWKIYSDANQLTSNQKYSIYLADKEYSGEINVTVGFDAGNNTSISKVTYSHTEGDSQNIIIRTNGSDLLVNGPKDSVSHYGLVNNLDISAVAVESYHEYGEVLRFNSFGSGRFVAESSAIFHQEMSYIESLLSGNKFDYANGSKYDNHEFSGEWIITTEPTCTEDGLQSKDCICGEHVTEPIAALGHSWDNGTPKDVICTGTSTVYTCTRCGETRVESSGNVDGHPESSLEILEAVTPTCTSTGLTEGKKCNSCGNIIISQEVIPAIGHNYGEISYTWKDGHSACSASMTCANCDDEVSETSTTITSEETRKASCEVQGEITYTVVFDNDAFKTQNVVETTEALGHIYGEISYDWTLNHESCIARMKCSRCDREVTRNATISSEITKEATCEEAGEITYTAIFEDEGFDTQTATAEISALEHSYGETSYSWNENHTICSATRECSICNKIESETATKENNKVTDESIKLATCEEDGERKYTAIFQNSAFETQTETITIKAYGHDFTNPNRVEYSWNEDNTICTAIKGCIRCEKTENEYSTSVTNEVTTEPTCETVGERTYTAMFENSALSATKTEEISALGHDFKDDYEFNAEYTSCSLTLTCSRCEKTENYTTEEITSSLNSETNEMTYTAKFTLNDGSIKNITVTVTVSLGDTYQMIDGVFCKNNEPFTGDYYDADDDFTYSFEDGNLVLIDVVTLGQSNNGESGSSSYHFYHLLAYPNENWDTSSIFTMQSNQVISSDKYLTNSFVVYMKAIVNNQSFAGSNYFNTAHDILSVYNMKFGTTWLYDNNSTIETHIINPGTWYLDMDFANFKEMDDSTNISCLISGWSTEDVQKYIDNMIAESDIATDESKITNLKEVKSEKYALPNLTVNKAFLKYLNSIYSCNLNEFSNDISEYAYRYTQDYKNGTLTKTYSEYLQENYLGVGFANLTYKDAKDLVQFSTADIETTGSDFNTGNVITYNGETLHHVEAEVIELYLKSYYTISYYQDSYRFSYYPNKTDIGYESIANNSNSIYSFNSANYTLNLTISSVSSSANQLLNLNNNFNYVNSLSPIIKCIITSNNI